MSHDITKIIENVVKEIAQNKAVPIEKVQNKPFEKMTLSVARKIIEAVEQKASEIGVKAVVAVCDAAGNPVAVECMDDAYIASYDIAVNKAFTVVSLKMSTKELAKLACPGGSLYGIQFTNNGRIVIFGGGEPLMKDGNVIGGLGVSGGTAQQDTLLGEYGRDYFISNLI